MGLNVKSIPMLSIVELLGIEHKAPVAGTVDCRCPFCNSSGYKLHVELSEGMFRCNRCGTNGGKLSLYTLVQYGRPYTKELRDDVLPKLFADLGLDNESASRYKATVQIPQSTPYTELSDTDMDERMTKIFNLPILALSEKDREKLLKRGLTEITIQHNKYRSVDYACIREHIPQLLRHRCKAENWTVIKNENDVLKKVPMEQFLCFLTLGEQAKRKGINLIGIPGAFSFSTPKGKVWGLRLYEGILIPIRNNAGQIVAAQVRTENADCKYMLLSSRGLQDGRTGKSRIHYPLANHEGKRKDSDSMVITEGPLKADVYCALSDHRHKAMALIGVNSTADLAGEIQANPEIRQFYDCFDADKLVNMAVMAGVEKIKKTIKEENRKVSSVYWDTDTAEHTLQKYLSYAKKEDIPVPELNGNIFHQLAQIAYHFHTSGIKVPKEMTHWAGETKGIDDYMFTQTHKQTL